jgi:hypothetical protein
MSFQLFKKTFGNKRKFRLLITTVYAWKWATEGIYGPFVLVILVYGGLFAMSDSPPLTPQAFALTLDRLDLDNQISLLSALLVIIGFLFAFHTATEAWKRQAHIQQKMDAASEITKTFSAISKLSTDINIYATRILRIKKALEEDRPMQEKIIMVQVFADSTKAFIESRTKLAGYNINMHDIVGSRYTLLSTMFGANKTLTEILSCATAMATAMWFPIPYLDVNDPDICNSFLSQVKEAPCKSYSIIYEKNQTLMNMLTGGLAGRLTADVIGFNFAMFVNGWGISDQLAKNISEIDERRASQTGRVTSTEA